MVSVMLRDTAVLLFHMQLDIYLGTGLTVMVHSAVGSTIDCDGIGINNPIFRIQNSASLHLINITIILHGGIAIAPSTYGLVEMNSVVIIGAQINMGAYTYIAMVSCVLDGVESVSGIVQASGVIDVRTSTIKNFNIAITAQNAEITIIDSTITSNIHGLMATGGWIDVSGSVFTYNGNAIRAVNCPLTMSKVKISNNGGPDASDASGVYVESTSETVTHSITDSFFTYNLNSIDAAVSLIGWNTVNFYRSHIRRNDNYGMFISSSSSVILHTDSVICGNANGSIAGPGSLTGDGIVCTGVLMTILPVEMYVIIMCIVI